MNLSYQRANPQTGNESFLLRFEQQSGRTACILVDAGDEVDVDSLLGDDECLTAVVLTHAHGDHYQSLAANVSDDTPIFASSGTAAVLETVLSDAERHSTEARKFAVNFDAVEALDDWVSPIDGLRLAPVPAGHVPGAAGFIFQFETDAGQKTVLATGDWTSERAAGYPGLSESLTVDVDAVFLTAAANDSYAKTLTESVMTICERTHAGSPVLATATGFMGLKYTYVLGHLADQINHPLQVRVAGQTAKLYDDLGYDVPNVSSVPVFDDPKSLLSPETVTIAGPEVPTGGSSGALFEIARTDPTATLVQLRSGGTEPVSASANACVVFEYEIVPHPSDDEIDAMVESLDPAQVVVMHQSRDAASRFTERYHNLTWTNADAAEYLLFEDVEWVAPPWMSDAGIAHARQGNGFGQSQRLCNAIDSIEFPSPNCERLDEVDLEAEGLNMSTFRENFQRPTTVDKSGSAGQDTSTIDAVDSARSEVETTVSGRVVDVGDGITLLRVDDELALADGAEVKIDISQSAEVE